MKIESEPQENVCVLSKEEMYSVFYGRIQDVNKSKKPPNTNFKLENFEKDAG